MWDDCTVQPNDMALSVQDAQVLVRHPQLTRNGSDIESVDVHHRGHERVITVRSKLFVPQVPKETVIAGIERKISQIDVGVKAIRPTAIFIWETGRRCLDERCGPTSYRLLRAAVRSLV